MTQLMELGVKPLIDAWCESKSSRAGITHSTRMSIRVKCNAVLSHLTDQPLTEATIVRILESKGQYSYRHRLAKMLMWVTKWAAENNLIPIDPLRKVKLPRPTFHHRKIWLDTPEIEAIKSLPIAGRLSELRDFFLLQCFTGLAYADVQSITRMSCYSAAGREWIKIVRRKTKQVAVIPINAEARAILDAYNWKISVPNNQEYNFRLKQIQEMAGIEKKLHSHLACKTFVQLYLSSGMSPESTAQMRGITVRTLIEHYGTLNELTLAASLKSAGF
jgi:integrase/recombinase XerD